jgi:uncharacterized protein (DUF952 family)
MRWLYHAVVREEWARAGDPYAPASFSREGFVHASYRDAVVESARLYLPPGEKVVLKIDPRLVGARVEEAQTPRGPMPHVHGAIPRAAIVSITPLDEFDAASQPDAL